MIQLKFLEIGGFLNRKCAYYVALELLLVWVKYDILTISSPNDQYLIVRWIFYSFHPDIVLYPQAGI